jgi:hypothetical protein
LLFLAGLSLLLALAGFAWVSAREQEIRAARIALLLAIATSIPFFLAIGLSVDQQVILTALLLGIAVVGYVVWFLPFGTSLAGGGRPSRRVDERDIMFARARLEPGSETFDAYYEMRPENRASDDRFRSLPGLLSPEAPLAEEVAFASAGASFAMTEAWRQDVDGPVVSTRAERPVETWVSMVKEFALHHGARDVGVTHLHPYHVYSHVGRGSGKWGEPSSSTTNGRSLSRSKWITPRCARPRRRRS